MLTATQVTLSALALIPVTSGVVSRYLALTPYRAVAWGRIWMLFTCALFDRQLLPAVLNLPLFALAARPVELAFGTPAYCLFLAAVSLTAALSVACLSLGTYAILKISSLMYVIHSAALRCIFCIVRRMLT